MTWVALGCWLGLSHRTAELQERLKQTQLKSQELPLVPRMGREPGPWSPLVISLEMGIAINPCSLHHNTFHLIELKCFLSLWCQTKSCFQLFASKVGPAPCCECVSQLTWSPDLCEVTLLPTLLNFSLFGLYSVTAAVEHAVIHLCLLLLPSLWEERVR